MNYTVLKVLFAIQFDKPYQFGIEHIIAIRKHPTHFCQAQFQLASYVLVQCKFNWELRSMWDPTTTPPIQPTKACILQSWSWPYTVGR